MNTRSDRIKWILIALFILWFFFSVSSYFVVHKPFSPQTTDTLSGVADLWSRYALSLPAGGQSLLTILVALWIAFIALGTGHWLWHRLGPAGADALETTLFSLGLGFGGMGLLTLALGLAGLLLPPLFYGLGLLLTLVAVPQALPLLRQMPWRRPSLPITLFLLLALGMAFTLALTPPTSWDALFYHLKGPKLYMQAGAIRPGIDIPHLNFPSLFQMLFLFGLLIRGDVVAPLLHFAFGLMLGGIVYATAGRLLRVKNSWLAVLLLFATPLVLVLSNWAYNDLALAFYGMSALYAFLRWQQSGAQRWLLVSGISAGLMMGMKYTSFVTPLFLGLLLLWHHRHRWRDSLRPLLAFAIPALLLLLPWLLKNWAFTGNPVYPFLFGGRFWDEFRATAYGNPGSGVGLDPIALLRLPYDLTLGLSDASQEGPIGPLYLALLPLLLFVAFGIGDKARPPAFRVILLYVLANYLFWTMGVIASRPLWQARLLLPGLVALCPVLAWTLEDLRRFDHPQFSLRRFLNLALGFVLMLLLVTQAMNWLAVHPLAYAAGTETRAQHLTRRLGAHYLAMEEINHTLPAGAVVTFLWEPRSYYCDLDCRPDSILDKFDHLVHRHRTAPAIADAWRAEGVTHVLLWRTGLNFLLQARSPTETPLPPPPVWQRLEQAHLEQVWTVGEGSYDLYRLPPD